MLVRSAPSGSGRIAIQLLRLSWTSGIGHQKPTIKSGSSLPRQILAGQRPRLGRIDEPVMHAEHQAELEAAAFASKVEADTDADREI